MRTALAIALLFSACTPLPAFADGGAALVWRDAAPAAALAAGMAQAAEGQPEWLRCAAPVFFVTSWGVLYQLTKPSAFEGRDVIAYAAGAATGAAFDFAARRWLFPFLPVVLQ